MGLNFPHTPAHSTPTTGRRNRVPLRPQSLALAMTQAVTASIVPNSAWPASRARASLQQSATSSPTTPPASMHRSDIRFDRIALVIDGSTASHRSGWPGTLGNRGRRTACPSWSSCSGCRRDTERGDGAVGRTRSSPGGDRGRRRDPAEAVQAAKLLVHKCWTTSRPASTGAATDLQRRAPQASRMRETAGGAWR